VTWQGWAVVVGFFGALCGLVVSLLPNSFAAFAAGLVGLTVLFVGICWMKGEPPSWRWGRRNP
jgi:uncharacterized membrane protein HdeD (DUF308 family)